jgi:threonine dehydratase
MDQESNIIPAAADIRLAVERISPFINRTPVLTSGTLDRSLNSKIFFKCENFQKVGAFKARGATNAILQLDDRFLSRGVATHSSGNHAQALSWAAAIRKCKAFIVMPDNSSRVKVEAVKGYGGLITFCEPTLAARESTLGEVLKKTGATEIHPYNDVHIISGQATAALELLEEIPDLDLIIAPVGGGGLLSGTALAAHYFYPRTKIIAAEPEQANDAYLSFLNKKFIPSVNPDTIADGLRTSLGSITYPIILRYVDEIVTVSELAILQAMRYTWERMKILIEPSSAVPLAALLQKKIEPGNKRIGVILSGGNMDLDQIPWIK